MKTPNLRLRTMSWLWTWGPVLLVMALIFVASAQPKYAPPGASAESVYMSGLMPIFTGDWDLIVKKGAHMITYVTLSVLLLRALRRTGHSLRDASLLAILLALSFALTDELHQAFVPGRHASVLDIGFDYVGLTSAALIARWWLNREKNAPLEPGSATLT